MAEQKQQPDQPLSQSIARHESRNAETRPLNDKGKKPIALLIPEDDVERIEEQAKQQIAKMPRQNRPGIKCNKCQRRGHIAADCNYKETKHGNDLVKKQLNEESQKQLGQLDAQIETLKNENLKYKEILEKSKQTNEKNWVQVEKALGRDINIRAPSGLIVEGLNLKTKDFPIFLNMVQSQAWRLLFWTSVTVLFSIFMLIVLETFLSVSTNFIYWEFGKLTFIQQIAFVLHWLFIPHATVINFFFVVLRAIFNFLSVPDHPQNIIIKFLIEICEWSHFFTTLFEALLIVIYLYLIVRQFIRIAIDFNSISGLMYSRDGSDYTKHRLTPILLRLQSEGSIKIDWERDHTFWEKWVTTTEINNFMSFLSTCWCFLKIFMVYPQFVACILPTLILELVKTIHIPVQMLETRDYYYDEYDLNDEPSLIRKYNIVRSIKINNPTEPLVDYDARPDNLALSKLNYIDPNYAQACASYEMPPATAIKMKNEYNSKMSVELFMQLTTPHIINLLDDEQSVKFRLNRSSVNFHGVNVDKYQHLHGQDVINTTLDVVFHYYRSRKWAYCQSCPDELFYTLPKN